METEQKQIERKISNAIRIYMLFFLVVCVLPEQNVNEKKK